MEIILFGSLLNPLSAITADFLYKNQLLKLIIAPKEIPKIRGGAVYLISQVCIAFYRYCHVFVRGLKIKSSGSYLSLQEFIVCHKDIPVIYFVPGITELDGVIRAKLRKESLDGISIFCCIFPYKITNSLLMNKRCVNIHPGKMPENRGPNPYFWALAEKAEKSAVTYHILSKDMDKGPVLFEEIFPIDQTFSEYQLEQVSAVHLKLSLPSFFEEIELFWSRPIHQGEGCYHSFPNADDRKRFVRRSVFKLNDILKK